MTRRTTRPAIGVRTAGTPDSEIDGHSGLHGDAGHEHLWFVDDLHAHVAWPARPL